MPDTAYIDRLQKRIALRLKGAELPLVQSFAAVFWQRNPEEDLASRDLDDDAGATIEALRRLRDRAADEVTIAVMNPQSSRDGWGCAHTVAIVAAPNMPFMVDSLLMALSHDGSVTHHLNNVVLQVDRDDGGAVTALSENQQGNNRELLAYAEIDRLEDDELEALQSKLADIVVDLQAAVEDFRLMKAQVQAIIEDLEAHPPPLESAEVKEGIAFLQWLLADHFTFLGYREFSYADNQIQQTGTALGLQRIRRAASSRSLAEQPERTRSFLLEPRLLSFSKSGTRSRVHRPAYPDYVGIRRFDAEGNVTGELGLLGLYTSGVYWEFPERIPVLRRKVASVLTRSGLDPTGFDGKVFAQVVRTYPRDELFQIDEDALLETALAITDIHERRQVRVFTRFDSYGLFATTLVYMPRDLFSTAVRVRLHDLLVEVFDAEDADHDILLSESILVRVQFNLRIRPGSRPGVERKALEARISQLIRDWHSELSSALTQHFGESQGRRLHLKYADAFTAGYAERYDARAAADDIADLESLGDVTPLATRLYRLPEDPADTVRLKLFHRGPPLPLSDVVPTLENLGLRVLNEFPYPVTAQGAPAASIHAYRLDTNVPLDVSAVAADFNDAFVRIWQRQVEDDGFNRLILNAGLSWRQANVLRAYAQYIKQIRFGFSQQFISDTLYKHTDIAVHLVTFFEQRFEPAADADEAVNVALHEAIVNSLEEVELLNEDRILRRILEVMEATQRTNYFVGSAAEPRPVLSLKLIPASISDIPRPVPAYEIFVSAPHVEGVHLRGGSIARGGLRWSDRLEDYRTEVLGLVKAQVVKNAVIVPTGAKGGFVTKTNRNGADCYRDFIRGLLDVTDNLVDGAVVPPEDVKVLDAPDPYLVVAADKGTATFSDYANEIAEDYGFWLHDAFASGGSNGYDHKKMGITARGAWVSVQRHFAEQDINVQQDSITVLGIGDMSGDVFGNGMLCSEAIKLVAAFNHQHIFVDPTPDPAASFAERRRLFELPRSSWTDYDAGLISAGGGVFSRTAKSIAISPEMQRAFGIEATTLAPDQFIHELLQSPVQLIWMGGIGTYVKASGESHDDVGDRGNDHLRIDANQLRCTAVGEGGNLGLTQRARIEFALNGGAVNTDFIDNAGGVDCSDHEVNIKIALNALVASEDLTRKQRNRLLEDMTDAVADLVLANNYSQTRSLSVAVRHAASRTGEYQRLIHFLEVNAGLDRALEYVPTEDELSDRAVAGLGLTRPEFAVLMAYSKIHVKRALIESNVHEDATVRALALKPFPNQLLEAHADSLDTHRLVREIIATQLANEMIDRLGVSFVSHTLSFVGGDVADIARAYVVMSACFEFDAWFGDLRDCRELPAQTQFDVLLDIMRLGRRCVRWMTRHCDFSQPLVQHVEAFKPSIERLVAARDGAVGEQGSQWLARRDALISAGMPDALAQKSAGAAELATLLPMIDMARQRACDETRLAQATIEIGASLQLDWLNNRLMSITSASHWQAMERDTLLDDLFMRQNLLGALVLEQADGDPERWLSEHPSFHNAWLHTVEEAQHATGQEFSMYAILLRRLSDLCARQGC